MVNKTAIKFVVGMWGIIVTSLGVWCYHDLYIETEQSNPIKQISVCRRHNELYEKIFGEDGYADTNKDGVLTFEEKAKAYRKLGYTNFFRDEKDFLGLIPISKLEKAIEEYMKKK